MTNKSPLSQLPDASCGTTNNAVPVFNCVVVFRRDEVSGRCQGRVANLAGIEADSANERDLLFALTRRFKSVVLEHRQAQQPIPWIDPPPEPQPGEHRRFVPVHL